MSEKPDADISELIQLMFVGLIGANNEIREKIKEFHEEHDRPSQGFLFFECLTHQPLPKEEKRNKIKHRIDETLVLGPFPGGLARKSLVMIPKDKEDFVVPTEEDILTGDIIIKMEKSKFAKHIYKRWINKYYKDPEKKVNFPPNNEPYFAEITNFTKDIFLKAGETADNSKNSFRVLHGLISPQLGCYGKAITAFVMPIASSQIFYGCLLVCVPQFGYDPKTELQKLNKLASKLRDCVKEYYVPALALIHEHFFEKHLDQDPKIKEHTIFKALSKTTLNANGKEMINVLRQRQFKSGGQEININNPICRRRAGDIKRCYSCDYFGWEQSSDNVVEKYLHKLWQDRFTGRTYIKKSLFFKKRLYTDPKILELLEKFLKPSKAKLKKEEDKVPSVLVEAEAGAGKEDIPKLLRLFSDCYNRGKTYKLNMAAIKPDAIAPLAMVGGEVTLSNSFLGKEVPQEIKLIGILKEIRKQTSNAFWNFNKNLKEKAKDYKIAIKNLKDTILSSRIKKIKKNINLCKNKDKKKELEAELNQKTKLKNKLDKKHEAVSKLSKNINNRRSLGDLSPEQILVIKELFGEFPTIVLDELNSMNVESQGILLRFLEQAEITPIGGYEDKMLEDGEDEKDYREFITDFLIVGLMNEDPEKITREKAISFLKKESYIGGLLGDLLYEHIMKIRRLRPDLRARMMRNDKFKMPKLADHRADIPHAFYRIINDTKKEAYFPNSEIRITMDALEYLMKPELEWNENFRLLEALVNKVVEIIYEDYENKTEITRIDGKELIIIREKHVRNAMKELGMEKEDGLKETPM